MDYFRVFTKSSLGGAKQSRLFMSKRVLDVLDFLTKTQSHASHTWTFCTWMKPSEEVSCSLLFLTHLPPYRSSEIDPKNMSWYKNAILIKPPGSRPFTLNFWQSCMFVRVPSENLSQCPTHMHSHALPSESSSRSIRTMLKNLTMATRGQKTVVWCRKVHSAKA